MNFRFQNISIVNDLVYINQPAKQMSICLGYKIEIEASLTWYVIYVEWILITTADQTWRISFSLSIYRFGYSSSAISLRHFLFKKKKKNKTYAQNVFHSVDFNWVGEWTIISILFKSICDYRSNSPHNHIQNQRCHNSDSIRLENWNNNNIFLFALNQLPDNYMKITVDASK